MSAKRRAPLLIQRGFERRHAVATRGSRGVWGAARPSNRGMLRILDRGVTFWGVHPRPTMKKNKKRRKKIRSPYFLSSPFISFWHPLFCFLAPYFFSSRATKENQVNHYFFLSLLISFPRLLYFLAPHVYLCFPVFLGRSL